MGGFDFSVFDFSEGFERLRRGFFGNEADHVPFIQQSHEFNMRFSGFPGWDYYSNPEKLVYGALTTAQAFGFEMPDGCWDSYNVEAEALGAKLITFGDLTPAIDNVTPIVRNEKDLAKLRPPVPGKSRRMGFAYDAAELMAEVTGEAPVLYCCGPFTLTTQIMTFEDVVMGMKDRPDFIRRVMTFVVEEVLTPYINEFAKRHPNMTANCGDAVASLPFITLDMSEDFALHYVERLRTLTGGRAYTDNWWGDSFTPDLDRFWQGKPRACPDYLKVQDPDLFKVGPEKAKAWAVERNLPVLLGVSNNLLQDGPVEEIEKRIHHYLELAEPGGYSLLYLCNFGARAPHEHVRVAVEAVAKYRRGERPWVGRYLDGNDDSATLNSTEKPAAQISVVDPDRGLTEAQEELLDGIFESVIGGLDQETPTQVMEALQSGLEVATILDDALIAAMEEIGKMFSDGIIFVPEMLLSARAMKGGLEVLRPLLTKSSVKPKGLVMLATVQGDVHDIGKNLVGMMPEGAGFKVVDIGVNIDPDLAMEKACELEPDVVGLSALLTTTMPAMGRIISAFRKADLDHPIIVGGAPVTAEFAERIEADGYAEDAPGAVDLVKEICARTKAVTCRETRLSA